MADYQPVLAAVFQPDPAEDCRPALVADDPLVPVADCRLVPVVDCRLVPVADCRLVLAEADLLLLVADVRRTQRLAFGCPGTADGHLRLLTANGFVSSRVGSKRR